MNNLDTMLGKLGATIFVSLPITTGVYDLEKNAQCLLPTDERIFF